MLLTFSGAVRLGPYMQFLREWENGSVLGGLFSLHLHCLFVGILAVRGRSNSYHHLFFWAVFAVALEDLHWLPFSQNATICRHALAVSVPPYACYLTAWVVVRLLWRRSLPLGRFVFFGVGHRQLPLCIILPWENC